MNPSIVSSISRLANYMPLGSYVIYTALETYSFSLGTSPAPITTIIQTPAYNYTCLYIPGGTFTYTSCTTDQSNALCISLSIGFFLAVFLSFLKHVPIGGTPPLAGEDGDGGDDGPGDGDNTVVVDDSMHTMQLQLQQGQQTGQVVRVRVGGKHKKIKYRSGVIYAQGNYYLDFGDYHIWGHALLSFVAFGTLSLFSSSVSQCLFPKVKPWIFVFTQIILLVICAFIAMFWIDDPSLSIGLMVASPTDTHGTQTAGGAVSMVSVSNGGSGPTGLRPGQFAAAATSNAATSTASAFPTVNLTQSSSSTTGTGTGMTTSNMFNNKNISSSSVFSATTAVNGNTNTCSCSCNPSANNNGYSTATSSNSTGTAGTNRLSGLSKRVATMSSVNEKQGDEEVHELSDRRSINSNSNSPTLTPPTTTSDGGRTATSQEWSRGEGGSASALVQGIMIASSLDSSSPPPPARPGSTSPSSSSDHVSVKMD